MYLSPLAINRLYYDMNGNKKISVKHLPSGKFIQMQINGNIDAPTSTPLKDWGPRDYNQVLSGFARHIYAFGTPRQKELLKDVFNDASLYEVMRGCYTPSQSELNQLHALLSKGRRERTRNALKSVINYSLTTSKRYGIFGRVMFSPKGYVHYCAGQDYTAELSTVVELLIK